MAKSIIIQENGTSKTLSVDKLRTKLTGGGTENWIPEEDAKIAPIIVRKNGTYKAKKLGLYGISKVVVDTLASGEDCEVTGTPKVGTIKTVNPAILEGGTARLFSTATITTNLSGGGTCDWVPETSIELKTKSIDKDGEYTASKNGCYGFSQVSVNVYHKADGSDKWPYKPDDPYDKGTDAPAYIRITTPPDKTSYSIGDTMNYTGIKCTMYKKDGTVFTDTEHPNGILVQSELTFPVDVAPEPEAES